MKLVDKGMTSICSLYRDEEVPDELIKSDNSMFLVEQDGNLFKLQNNPLFTMLSEMKPKKGTVKEFLDKQLGEPKYKTGLVYSLKTRFAEHPLPLDILRYSMKYFREIFKKHGTEAAVVLMVHPQRGDWKLLKVMQVDCSHGGVHYLNPKSSPDNIDEDKEFYEEVFSKDETKELMLRSHEEYSELLDQGYSIFGTIHSHCDFSAFHSGTDNADELDFDGLHITVGHVNSNFSFACRFMVATAAFPQEITEVVGVEEDGKWRLCTLDEITRDIDSVEVDEFHMDLMQPQLQRARPATKVYQLSQNVEDHTEDYEWKNQYTGRDWSNWQQESNYEIGVQDTDVVEENDYVRVYDLIDGKVLLVKKSHFNKEAKHFGGSNYHLLENGQVPDESVKEYLRRKKMEKDLAEESEILIMDDPEINPTYSTDVISPDFRSSQVVNADKLAVKATQKKE